MSNVFIHQHQGIGDFITIKGMVEYICRERPDSSIYLFVKEIHVPHVKILYNANPRINIIPFPNEYAMCMGLRFVNQFDIGDGELIRIGFNQYNGYLRDHPGCVEKCDEIFYGLMDVDFDLRFQPLGYTRDDAMEDEAYKTLNPNDEPFIFLHDDPRMGYNIDLEKVNTNLKIIRNDFRFSVFHMIKILEKATEIHCMESCYRCLIENTETIGENQRLVLHSYVRNLPIATRKNWEII